MREFLRRLQYLTHRGRLDQELANDMEFHREMAAREGKANFGNQLQLREEARDAWGWTWIDRSWQDFRFAARMLRRSPGFTLAAVLMLAIGIGVNVAAFGFFDLMVLQPLPVRDPATLLRFQRFSPKGYASVLPYPELAFFREHTTTLSAMLAWSGSTLTMESQERPVKAHFVTANYFTELGAGVRLGRLLDPSRDEARGAEPVVVLSEGFWERHFGADPSIPGRTIHLNGKPVTVVGVASGEFSGVSLDDPDMWIPIVQHPYFVNGSKKLTDYSVEHSGEAVWGRLKPRMSPKAAEEELRSLAVVLRAAHPDDIWENETLPSEPGGYATGAMSGSHHGTGTKDPNQLLPVSAMIGALVLLILAVACSNLGSLLLARGVTREREISIRVAVGAGKGRLVRQLFTESLLLGLLGSAAGLGLGYVVLQGLMAMSGTPKWLDPSPDWRVMLFAVAMGFTAAIVFGLMPAFQVVRQRHRATLMRHILIGAQVAASCVLLIVAGLLVRALNQASSNPGFEYQQVISIDPGLGSHAYSAAQSRAYIDLLQARLRDLPGVDAVSFASTPPFGNKTITMGMENGGRVVKVHPNEIDPQYFQTLKIPLLRGRGVVRGDANTIVVSQSLAAFALPAEDPLGKPLELAGTKYSVVGIAADVRVAAPQDQDETEAYFLAGTPDLPAMVALVRTTGRAEQVLATVASISKSIDPKIIPEVQMMKSMFQKKLKGSEYGALSVSLLAFVALLLACLGIVGLVAYAVSQRTREIGIRMALGAKPSHVLGVVLRQFSSPVAAGLVIGVGGAAALTRLLRGLLYGISNLDPASYVAAVAIFLLTVAVAVLAPARSALRVDPIKALRHD
jgi:predicted permease